MAGWRAGCWGGCAAAARARPRLELVERIALAPRQSLALVEAEGRRFLVATSPEGAPAFYALDEQCGSRRGARHEPAARASGEGLMVAAWAAGGSGRAGLAYRCCPI